LINSRKIEDLHPKVRALAEKHIEECARLGIDIILTSTYRDGESQSQLYAIGRTTVGAGKTASRPMGRVVTNAKAGQSFHNYRVAYDVVPIVHGKAVWNDKRMWELVGKVGQSLGLEWAGAWKTFKEMPHFQYTEGLKLSDFRAGKTLSA